MSPTCLLRHLHTDLQSQTQMGQKGYTNRKNLTSIFFTFSRRLV